jgi:hypothetical protein
MRRATGSRLPLTPHGSGHIVPPSSPRTMRELQFKVPQLHSGSSTQHIGHSPISHVPCSRPEPTSASPLPSLISINSRFSAKAHSHDSELYYGEQRNLHRTLHSGSASGLNRTVHAAHPTSRGCSGTPPAVVAAALTDRFHAGPVSAPYQPLSACHLVISRSAWL